MAKRLVRGALRSIMEDIKHTDSATNLGQQHKTYSKVNFLVC